MLPGTNKTVDRSLAFLEGEQWGGIPELSVILKSTGLPPTAAAASAIIQFRKDWVTETISHTLSTANAEIVMTSGPDWTFVTPEQPLPLKEGDYVWGFQITDITGASRTYETGSITVGPRGIL